MRKSLPIVITLAALLVGCGAINADEIEMGKRLCENKGGIGAAVRSFSQVDIQCKDGTWFENIQVLIATENILTSKGLPQ